MGISSSRFLSLPRFAWFIGLVGLAGSAVGQTWSPGPGWTLLWADEFEAATIDAANWTYDLGAHGWGNNELQNYTRTNASIENGSLVIEARKEANGGYTSSRLKTQGLRAWKYGKIAARIRLPQGQGIWPAFWMLGENISTVSWPKCGEIDIMEMIGGGENRDDTYYGTLHWDANNAAVNHGSGARELPEPQWLHQEYHVFEVEWNATEVIWKRDGVEFFRTSVDTALWPTMDEFHRPFFIVLNVAVGGEWPGNPNATTVFPQRMAVDWVRVYQLEGNVARPTVTPATQAITAAGAAAFAATPPAGGGLFTYQWRKAGVDLAAQTGAALTVAPFASDSSSVYDVVLSGSSGSIGSQPVIAGLASTARVAGGGTQTDDHVQHPNGKFYDQVLLTGTAVTITADYENNEITRTSYIDVDGDIVQVEFAGPGSLSLVLDQPSGPAVPEKYNQDLAYMKGHAGIVIVGADERTNVSVFTVGRATANDPTGAFNLGEQISATNDPAKNGSPLFTGHPVSEYDGIADIAFIAIASTNGRFGGVRTANANYFASRGYTGVYAPGISFSGPVLVGDITAFDSAKPVLMLGSASDVRITGGDLAQANGADVHVKGVTQLVFTAGADSHNRPLTAQRNQAVLLQDGQNVTTQIVRSP